MYNCDEKDIIKFDAEFNNIHQIKKIFYKI